MPEKPPRDRRKMERRRPEKPRRSTPARRTGRSKRKPERQSPGEQERRRGRDRRTPIRRAGRRRRRLDRRIGDRREDLGAYSRHEIGQIRGVLLNPRLQVACPRCDGPLTLRAPVARGGSTLREVHCSTCHCGVSITDYAVASVLVIDHDELVRDGLCTILGGAGHEVLAAPDGETGLEWHREEPADVIFVDMVVPGMDGLEFIRLCRKESPDTRIVALAGQRRHGVRDLLAMAKQLGQVQILRKPFRQDDVLRVLDDALGVVPPSS